MTAEETAMTAETTCEVNPLKNRKFDLEKFLKFPKCRGKFIDPGNSGCLLTAFAVGLGAKVTGAKRSLGARFCFADGVGFNHRELVKFVNDWGEELGMNTMEVFAFSQAPTIAISIGELAPKIMRLYDNHGILTGGHGDAIDYLFEFMRKAGLIDSTLNAPDAITCNLPWTTARELQSV